MPVGKVFEMCSRVRCGQCGKIGWSGCGAHVDQILRGIAEEDRCKCREKPKPTKPAGRGWLFGRRR